MRVQLNYTPRPWFLPFHRRTQRFAHITAHRRCGKTVACVRDTEKRALVTDLPDAKYAYIAPQLKQAKRNVWGYMKQGYYSLRQYGAKAHESELHVTYPNGARFQIFGANDPDALRGDYLDGVIIDEFAFMKPEIWTDIVLPMLTDRGGWAVFIGSPNGRNTFYDLRRYAMENQDEWFVDLLRASETHAIPEKELARARAMMTDARYQREYECSFDVEGSAQLFSFADIEAAFKREPTTRGLRAIGIDPARFGDDHTGLVARVGNKLLAKQYEKLDVVQVAGMGYQMMLDVRPHGVFVDETGLGAGVVDNLRQMNYVGNVGIYGINYSGKPRDDIRFRDLKAECWWLMRDWIRRHGSLQDAPQRLIDDLLTPEYDFNLKGQVYIESKDDIKERGLPSPDLGDALANTFGVNLMATEDEISLDWLQRGNNQQNLSVEPRSPFEDLDAALRSY